MKFNTKQKLIVLFTILVSTLIFVVTFSLINCTDINKNTELAYCWSCIVLNVALLFLSLCFLPRLEYKLKLMFLMLFVPIFIGSIGSLPYCALLGYVYQIIIALCSILNIWYTNHKLIKRANKVLSKFTNIYDERIQNVIERIKLGNVNFRMYLEPFAGNFNKLYFLFADGKENTFYIKQDLEYINNAYCIKFIKRYNHSGRCYLFDIKDRLKNENMFSIETEGERVVIKDRYNDKIIESYVIHGADKCINEAVNICSVLGTHTISDIIYERNSVDIRKVYVKKENELIRTLDFNTNEQDNPHDPSKVNYTINKIKDVLEKISSKDAWPIPAIFGFNKVEEEYLLKLIQKPKHVPMYKNEFIQLDSMRFVSPYQQAVFVEKIYRKIKNVNNTLVIGLV